MRAPQRPATTSKTLPGAYSCVAPEGCAFAGQLTGSVLPRLVLDDLPEVTAEAAPVEPLAPRRMHRRRDKGVHQASAVPSFDLLRLPEYGTGWLSEKGIATALAAFPFPRRRAWNRR